MRSKNLNMLSGSITKGLISLTIPIMIMNVMQSLFSITDMTILKVFSDDTSVGSVGACSMLISLCTNLLIGISTGANVIVARRIGLHEKESADKSAVTAIIFSIISGTVLMIIGVVCAATFLRLTNCPESLFTKAVIYFKIYFCGMPVQMLYNFCASILRAIGDTKKPMYFLITGGFIKLVFTIIFVTIFGMDVEGVAIATVISNVVISLLALYTLLKRQKVLEIDLKNVKFDFGELKDMLFIGIPAGLQGTFYSLANVLISKTVNTFGADATTGISIANQFDNILYQISCATSLATAPYVSQNFGARNIKRVKQTLVRSVIITIAFGATFGTLSAVFSAQLSSIMSSTPAVIEFSKQKMTIISSTYFICGINEVLCGVLRGIGKPIVPMISTFLYMCLFRVAWIYLIFPLCPNLTFLYTVWPVSWVLSCVTLLITYNHSMVKLQNKTVSASC